jgi:hypothetical protein
MGERMAFWRSHFRPRDVTAIADVGHGRVQLAGRALGLGGAQLAGTLTREVCLACSVYVVELRSLGWVSLLARTDARPFQLMDATGTAFVEPARGLHIEVPAAQSAILVDIESPHRHALELVLRAHGVATTGKTTYAFTEVLVQHGDPILVSADASWNIAAGGGPGGLYREPPRRLTLHPGGPGRPISVRKA